MLLSILRDRRFALTAVVGLIAFALLYLAAMDYLYFAEGAGGALAEVRVAPDWRALALRARGPFLYEPVAAFHVGSLVLLVALPNLAIALGLGALVGANVAVSAFALLERGAGAPGAQALAGALPALLSGAACCVPTLFLALGLQLTAGLAALWPLLLPISVVLLVFALWWSLRGLRAGSHCRTGRR